MHTFAMVCNRLCLLSFILLFVFAYAGGPSYYPCPGAKAPMGAGVSCKEVKLPKNLCSACPLRAPHSNGQFKDCSNIYDTFQPSCMAAMNQYVKANPCDKKRKQIMDDLNGPNPSAKARIQLDYTLYSVCEQCCDCIPMGASKSKDKGKWVTDRGNCPAHAWYDVCAVFPEVTHFVTIGQSTPGKFIGAPKACPMLTSWAKSPAFNNWQKNPKTKISGKLNAALASMLDAVQCSNGGVWNKCYDLEYKQNNLGTPGDFKGIANSGSAQGNSETKKNNDYGNNDSKSGSKDKSGGKSSSGSQSGGCTGLLEWGCTEWDPAAQQCKSHGCKCFPDKPADPSTSCVKNSGGNGGGGGGSSSKKSGKDTSKSSGTSSSPSSAVGCTGLFEWGCLNWDPVANTCKSHGCKCFPDKPADPKSSCVQVTKSVASDKKEKSCFPIDATATLRDGTPVAMTNLRIGDEVMVSPGVYSRVYLFTHRHGDIQTRQLQIRMRDYTLTISPGHHLPINGEVKAAMSVKVGDSLQTVGGEAVVREVKEVWATGLYNPHTLAGTIVVNGVVCSTYTVEVDDMAAHALLSPIRTAFRAGAVSERRAAVFMQYGASSFLD